jgi:hypothetical protein
MPPPPPPLKDEHLQVKDEHPHQMDGRLVSFVASFAIVVSIVCVVTFLFTSKDPPVSQQRLAICLLAFALSTVSCLLFFPKVKIEGVVFGLAISVVGPAALWLIAVLILVHSGVFPLEDKRSTAQMVDDLVKSVEDFSGWKPYDKWLGDLSMSGLAPIVTAGGFTTLRNLLWYTSYIPGGYKLRDPTVSITFIYWQNGDTAKIERIRGHQEGPTFELLYGSEASTLKGKARSIMLVASRVDPGQNPNVESNYINSEDIDDSDGKEVTLRSPSLDCFVLADYTGDEITVGKEPIGDYVAVDMKRFSNHARGPLRLGILSERAIEVSKSYVVRLGPEATAQTPLIFQDLVATASTGADIEDFEPWLSFIDTLDGNGSLRLRKATTDGIMGVRKGLLSHGTGAASERKGLAQLLKSSRRLHHYSFVFTEARDVTFLIFKWK